MNQKPIIFLDMDGVLVDLLAGIRQSFDLHWPRQQLPKDEFNQFRHKLYSAISQTSNFWENLPILPEAHALMHLAHDFEVHILTAIPKAFELQSLAAIQAKEGKYQWIKNNFLAFNGQFHTCYAYEKHLVIDQFSKDFSTLILIDDAQENIADWNAKQHLGAKGILHSNPHCTAQQLVDLQIIDTQHPTYKGLMQIDQAV